MQQMEHINVGNWWEAPELDRVLWRNGTYRPYWGKRHKPTPDYIDHKFAEFYPHWHITDFFVKERAVWRAIKAQEKRTERRNKKRAPDTPHIKAPKESNLGL